MREDLEESRMSASSEPRKQLKKCPGPVGLGNSHKLWAISIEHNTDQLTDLKARSIRCVM
jgi:hypothetical protein